MICNINMDPILLELLYDKVLIYNYMIKVIIYFLKYLLLYVCDCNSHFTFKPL